MPLRPDGSFGTSPTDPVKPIGFFTTGLDRGRRRGYSSPSGRSGSRRNAKPGGRASPRPPEAAPASPDLRYQCGGRREAGAPRPAEDTPEPAFTQREGVPEDGRPRTRQGGPEPGPSQLRGAATDGCPAPAEGAPEPDFSRREGAGRRRRPRRRRVGPAHCFSPPGGARSSRLPTARLSPRGPTEKLSGASGTGLSLRRGQKERPPPGAWPRQAPCGRRIYTTTPLDTKGRTARRRRLRLDPLG